MCLFFCVSYATVKKLVQYAQFAYIRTNNNFRSLGMPQFLDSQTALVHAPRNAPQLIQTVQPPLYRASTIMFDNTAQLYNRHWTDAYDYSYGTHGTPTTYTLADSIAQLEQGLFCVLAPSGLSAITLVNMALLKSGDEVWIADNAYGPNLDHLRFLQQHYGISVCLYDAVDVSRFKPSHKAKLLWLEPVGSVSLEFPDLIGLIQKAKAAGIICALDNTWGAGLAFNPFALGDEQLSTDISVHALTKYPSGGADILMGSLVTRDQNLHQQLLKMHALQGIAVSGDDVAQIMRSLPHMALRYRQQDLSCRKILAWLKQQAKIVQVLHPADPDSAGHIYWKNICKTNRAAGLVTAVFDAKYDHAAVRRFCDALQLFKLGFSWGGPISLVMLYDLTQMRSLPNPRLKSGYMVRLCIGLEHTDDLISDLQQALLQLNP